MALAGVHLLEHIQTPALGVVGGQVTFANAAAAALLGGHVVGQDVRIAIRNPKAVAVILDEKGGTARIDGLSVGGSVWEVHCHVVGPDERLVTLYDLSVQASTARAHADFVANASHELRTPATGIRALAEALTSGALHDPEKAESFVKQILRQSERLTQILDDMLTLTQVERGPELLRPRWLPVREALSEAISRVQPAAVLRDLALTLETGERDQVYADPDSLQTALVNLLDNAVKYSPDGGEVRLEGRAVTEGYAISVSDQGPGIPAQHQARIFERFYRVDQARSRATGGTGLGLSIVKHVMEAHRGRVAVHSEGPGSTFVLFFPAPLTKP